MRRAPPFVFILALLLFVLFVSSAWTQTRPKDKVRAAVIGGLGMSGFWQRLATRIEADTGIQLQVVASGNKEVIVPPFVAGEADLMFIHASDEVNALLAEGKAGHLTAWGANEHVIVGPDADPAKVRQAKTAAEALQRIAQLQAPFVEFDDPGSHAIVQKLWRINGFRPPAGNWRLRDDTERAQGILEFAAAHQAYVVTGHIPVAYGKMHAPGMAVLLKGDPAMRRPYVMVEHPESVDKTCTEVGSPTRRVVAYLASSKGQLAVKQAGIANGEPWVFPLRESE